jgi:hypothetical protein
MSLLDEGLSIASEMLDATEEILDLGSQPSEKLTRQIIASYRAALVVMKAADNMVEVQNKVIEKQAEEIRLLKEDPQEATDG